MYTGEFIVDGLTECIIEAKTGKKRETEVLPARMQELRQVGKKNGWKFNWRKEALDSSRQLYLLRIVGEDEDGGIQGLISVTPEPHNKWIHMSLIEAAPHNLGKGKSYIGVPGNLVAFICNMSFELGFEGFVHFVSKTKLIEHYKNTLGATSLRLRNQMVIETKNAQKLVYLYFKKL